MLLVGLSQCLPYVNRLLDVKKLKLVMLEKILISLIRKNKFGHDIRCCFHLFYCLLKSAVP